MTRHVPMPIALGTFLTLHFLVFVITCAKMVGASSGTVEVDLIFPRNETYTPTAKLPIIFAFQNSYLAPFLDPIIEIRAARVQNTNGSTPPWRPYDGAFLEQLRWANFTNNNTYFAYPSYQQRNFNFETEGIWEIFWILDWANCTAKSDHNDRITRNSSEHKTFFTIKKGAQDVDLVSGTMDKSCSGQEGVAINITNTLSVDGPVKWEGQGDMCASMASSFPKPDPCRVSIDPTTAARISCELGLANSSATGSPLACPKDEKSAAGRITIRVLAALFGVLSHFLN